MDIATYHYLKSNDELRKFVRYNPMWYRYLMRDPSRINELEKEAKEFYGKTFSQRVQKVNNQVQLIEMLLELARNMKD